MTKISDTEKIVIAQNGGVVSLDFDDCESYAVFRVGGGTATRLADLTNSTRELKKLPVFFAKEGITKVLVGDISQQALNLFQEKQITVVRGVSGEVDTVAAACATGTFVLSDCSCTCTCVDEECGHPHKEGKHRVHQDTRDFNSCDCHDKEKHHAHRHICESSSCDCHGDGKHHMQCHVHGE
jgi:predicted Fe-Mo cluster-binding NifX family protein